VIKKVLLLCIALSVLFFLVATTLVSAEDASTVNGWVSDSQCGAKGMAEGHAECAKKCMAKGAKMVVVTDADKKVLMVDNPDVLKGHEGHHVAVTGHVMGDSIHVDSVKML
jgi:hypothetical protein